MCCGLKKAVQRRGTLRIVSYAESLGRWTTRLIGQLDFWLFRKVDETNFYLTQFLTGNGYFRAYLHKMEKMSNPRCIYGDCRTDDAVYIENINRVMLQGKEKWTKVTGFIEAVLRQKKQEMDAGPHQQSY